MCDCIVFLHSWSKKTRELSSNVVSNSTSLLGLLEEAGYKWRGGFPAAHVSLCGGLAFRV